MSTTSGLLRIPLLIAAAVVVIRIVLEQLGMPRAVVDIFGVTWLLVLVPAYFGFRIGGTTEPSPFKPFFKLTVSFVALVRLMIIPTYWLAYALNWQSYRFLTEFGGNVGEGIGPLAGYLLIPIRNFFIWLVLGSVAGGLAGSIVLAIRRKLKQN